MPRGDHTATVIALRLRATALTAGLTHRRETIASRRKHSVGAAGMAHATDDGMERAHLLSIALAAPVVLVASTAGAERCPAGMARVGDSCIDRYEASLVEVRDDGREIPLSPYETPGDRHVHAVSRPNVVPQAYISLVQARAACDRAGKRLCRRDEWRAACRGPADTDYPYGDRRVGGACIDTGRTSPMWALWPQQYTFDNMNDPRLNQIDNTVAATGSAESCTNDYGVYDMVGNVHEWIDEGDFLGGYYLDTKLNGEGCNYTSNLHFEHYRDYSTGFRCCADPIADPFPAAEEIEPAEVRNDRDADPAAAIVAMPGAAERIGSKVRSIESFGDLRRRRRAPKRKRPAEPPTAEPPARTTLHSMLPAEPPHQRSDV